MVDPALVMHKHVYIKGNYNPIGTDFLAKKAIPLTENTKLVIAVFQEQEPSNSNSRDTTVLNQVTYSIHAWEVCNDDYQQFTGTKLLSYQNHINPYSRHLVAHVLLKNGLQEEHQHYTHYEIELDVVIFETLDQIYSSLIQFP